MKHSLTVMCGLLLEALYVHLRTQCTVGTMSKGIMLTPLSVSISTNSLSKRLSSAVLFHIHRVLYSTMFNVSPLKREESATSDARAAILNSTAAHNKSIHVTAVRPLVFCSATNQLNRTSDIGLKNWCWRFIKNSSVTTRGSVGIRSSGLQPEPTKTWGHWTTATGAVS